MKIVIALFLLSCSQLGFAQALSAGDWEGAVIMPEEESTLVKYRIREIQKDDSITYKVTMYYNERPYEFEKISVSKNKLKFVVDTGSKYQCELVFKRGQYNGECLYKNESVSRVITMSMIKPEAEEVDEDNEESESGPVDEDED